MYTYIERLNSYLKTNEGNWKDDSRVFVDITGSDPEHLVDVLRRHHRLQKGLKLAFSYLSKCSLYYHQTMQLLQLCF